MHPSAERRVGLSCGQCGTSLPLTSRFCLSCGTPVPAPPPEAAPPPVDSLRDLLQQELGGEIAVGEEQGKGPLTISFAGTDKRDQRPVLIHAVPPELARIERGVVDRLLRTARASSKLRHPRVVPVLRVAAGDRLAWYVTGADAGTTLQDVLEKDWQLPIERVANIVGQAAMALSLAHEQGVIHGGLTPDSVLVGEGDVVSVRDFGVARASRTGSEYDAGRNADYQAPELDASANPLAAAGIDNVAAPGSAPADQYALGVITYQMLTGTLPFMGTSTEAVRIEHRMAHMPPLSVSRPDLPSALSTVLERALAKNPADRFAGVARFAAAFRLAVQGRANPSRGVNRKSGDTLLFPESASGSAHRRSIRSAVMACAATATLVLVAWQSKNAPWSSDTVNSPLVPPESAQEAPPPVSSAYGTTEPVIPPMLSDDSGTPAESRPQPRTDDTREPQRRTGEQDRAAAQMGSLTLGTNPPAVITINGIVAPSNPVRNWSVPAGRVTLHFELSSAAAGSLSRDTVVTITAGESLNLGFLRLGSQP